MVKVLEPNSIQLCRSSFRFSVSLLFTLKEALLFIKFFTLGNFHQFSYLDYLGFS